MYAKSKYVKLTHLMVAIFPKNYIRIFHERHVHTWWVKVGNVKRNVMQVNKTSLMDLSTFRDYFVRLINDKDVSVSFQNMMIPAIDI